MIIVSSPILLNMQAAQTLSNGMNGSPIQCYPAIDLGKSTGNVITIIDLKADGEFQALVDPALFAKQLILDGLSQNIKKINLVISDVSITQSMFTFAQKFCNALAEQGILLEVHVAGDLNYLTFINPPSPNNKKWEVYGISISDYRKDFNEQKFNIATLFPVVGEKTATNNLCYDFLMKYDKKQRLWEGENLLEWLASGSDHVIIPRNPGAYSFSLRTGL